MPEPAGLAIEVLNLVKHFATSSGGQSRGLLKYLPTNSIMKTDRIPTRFALAAITTALLISISTGAASAHPAQSSGKPQDLAKTTVTLPSGKKIRVEVARTEVQRSIGMMWRTRVSPDAGMLFVFDDEAQQAFWMKNTLVDLDMVFIDSDKQITSIAANVPRSSPDAQDDRVAVRAGRGRYVLELPAGAAARYHLGVGQSLRFDPEAVGMPPKPRSKRA